VAQNNDVNTFISALTLKIRDSIGKLINPDMILGDQVFYFDGMNWHYKLEHEQRDLYCNQELIKMGKTVLRIRDRLDFLGDCTNIGVSATCSREELSRRVYEAYGGDDWDVDKVVILALAEQCCIQRTDPKQTFIDDFYK
jgi:hypothetical protein